MKRGIDVGHDDDALVGSAGVVFHNLAAFSNVAADPTDVLGSM